VGDRHRVPRRYSAAEELFADPDLDAFVIVTPDEQHASQGLQALTTGRPVFIEKPLAASWQEAEHLRRGASGSWCRFG
jgi:1,5-anhydro-D-fructose reductase (1,5-anhydro-D-mannitol-forming)